MKFLALAGMLVCHYAASPARAQETPPSGLNDAPPSGLNIVVVEGEGAVDNWRQHVSHEPIIRAEDNDHKPIKGASVVFSLPTDGPTGVFGNGSPTLIVTTDSNGLAVGKGFRANPVSGNLLIHVSANFRGLSARTTISQTNEGVAGAKASTGGGGHGKLIAILAVVGAAAGGGAYYATHRSSSSTSTSTPTSPGSPSSTAIGLSPGTGIIIGPH